MKAGNPLGRVTRLGGVPGNVFFSKMAGKRLILAVNASVNPYRLTEGLPLPLRNFWAEFVWKIDSHTTTNFCVRGGPVGLEIDAIEITLCFEVLQVTQENFKLISCPRFVLLCFLLGGFRLI